MRDTESSKVSPCTNTESTSLRTLIIFCVRCTAALTHSSTVRAFVRLMRKSDDSNVVRRGLAKMLVFFVPKLALFVLVSVLVLLSVGKVGGVVEMVLVVVVEEEEDDVEEEDVY